MPLDIIIGTQWGDEGKGRITDLLAAQANIVARYSGGDNAGHTITIGADVFKLHLIPSGIVHENVVCLIGNGVVMNPAVVLREMDALTARGVDVSPARLKISTNTHLVTPAHIAIDRASERLKGSDAIGTTQRGIGPAYTDKAARSGLRASLLADPEALADAMYDHIAAKNTVLRHLYSAEPLDAEAVAVEYLAYARRLAPHLTDGSLLLHNALRNGDRILAEGAQGTMLDIDHGTYPFVTSSAPTASGALVGLGLGPSVVGRVVGVAKAFSSRVGGGPFATELDGDEAHRLRGSGANPWDEYGTTTGRPRRVGWLDLVVLRYAARINGLTELVLTKLDILSGLPEIPVCVAYRYQGRRLDHLPGDPAILAQCMPVYVNLPGWKTEIGDVRRMRDLPDAAQGYINFVADVVETPVRMVSVGPARSHTVYA
ncbi:MAG: adenylosuccinate synthase [Anaerolineae bacterium]|nr:adenylosuccinate synthase [Anaerolineae bacterium]